VCEHGKWLWRSDPSDVWMDVWLGWKWGLNNQPKTKVAKDKQPSWFLIEILHLNTMATSYKCHFA
jgi:hypothetical protein